MTLEMTKTNFRSFGKLADGCFECLFSDEKLIAVTMIGMVIGRAIELRRSVF